MIISGLGSGKGWEPENEREKKMWRKKNGLERERIVEIGKVTR